MRYSKIKMGLEMSVFFRIHILKNKTIANVTFKISNCDDQLNGYFHQLIIILNSDLEHREHYALTEYNKCILPLANCMYIYL